MRWSRYDAGSYMYHIHASIYVHAFTRLAKYSEHVFQVFRFYKFSDTKNFMLQNHSYSVTIAHSLVAQLSTEFIISYTFQRQVATPSSCPESRLVGPHEH